MEEHHYLGFHSLTGKTLKYVALLEGQWVALIGWGSAALKSRHREKWVGWSQEQKAQRLKFIANNQRFLILPGIQIENLASKVLALLCLRDHAHLAVPDADFESVETIQLATISKGRKAALTAAFRGKFLSQLTDCPFLDAGDVRAGNAHALGDLPMGFAGAVFQSEAQF